MRKVNSDLYIHALKPGTDDTTTAKHYSAPVDTLPMKKLMNMLCSAGPGLCKSCRLCEYGKEYIKRCDEKEANTMYFQITCSNCGHRSAKHPYNGGTTPEKIIDAGWNSYGNALYCPKCVKTWSKRNGDERHLSGAAHTKDRIQIVMIDDLVGRIENQGSSGRR